MRFSFTAREAPLVAINHVTGDALDAEIASKLLLLPAMIGSTSSSCVMLELTAIGRAPAALILAEPDAILSFGGNVGCMVVLGEHSVDRRHVGKGRKRPPLAGHGRCREGQLRVKLRR